MTVTVTPADAAADVATTEASGLLGTHCATCDRSFYPARALCPTCWTDDLPSHRLPSTGRVATWTVVRLGKAFPTPYALCYADFDGDVRVLGRVTSWSEEQPLRAGDVVTVHAVETVPEDGAPSRTLSHTFTVDRPSQEA